MAEDIKTAKNYFLVGNYVSAEKICLNILKKQKNNLEVIDLISKVYFTVRDFTKASIYFQRLINYRPENLQALNDYGICCIHKKDFKKALSLFDHALSIDKNYDPPRKNRLYLLGLLEKNEKILEDLNFYFEKTPNDLNNIIYKGKLEYKCLLLEDLDKTYERFISIDNKNTIIQWQKLYNLARCCKWNDLKKEKSNFLKITKKENLLFDPFIGLILSDSLEFQKLVSTNWTIHNYSKINPLGNFNKNNNKKIRIGYFSSDFKNHPMSYIIGEILEKHDRSQFEIIGFSLTKKNNDELHTYVKNFFDDFFYVDDLLSADIASLARGKKLDIAIDLNGYSNSNRADIFSYRLAPIQISFIGFPGTMGASFIDYIIADKIVIPEEHKKFYVEKVAYMPHSYYPRDRNIQISKVKKTRKSFGIPDNAFVYCCFNNNHKISEEMALLWVQILKNVKNSVIWLLEDNNFAKKNLIIFFESKGISINRLIFSPRMQVSEHLARHQLANLFLDTLPYNAHTTASDALWCKLPVLTLIGKTFSGRVAASILHALDMSELITYNVRDYVAVASELGQNKSKYIELKNKLEDKIITSPFFNMNQYTKDLENLFIKMHKRSSNNLLPEHIN